MYIEELGEMEKVRRKMRKNGKNDKGKKEERKLGKWENDKGKEENERCKGERTCNFFFFFTFRKPVKLFRCLPGKFLPGKG